MGRRACELLNHVSEIVLADVVNLRLGLLPCWVVVVGGVGVCVGVSKVRLVQRALPYVLPSLVHTQMVIVMPVLGIVHSNLPTLETQ